MKNYGQTSESSMDSGILSNPLSFLRSGSFRWNSAGLYDRGGNGYYWSLRSANTTSSSSLDFSNTSLTPQVNVYRSYGFAVRFVSTSKSFTTLINTSYSMNDTETSRDSGILSSPLSLLRSGLFGWRGASLSDRGTYGYFWSLQSTSATYSGALDFGNNRLRLHVGSDHAYGFAVRSEAFLTLFRILKRIYGFLLETT